MYERPEYERIFTDEELIDMSIERFEGLDLLIDHATARMIASRINSGPAGALSLFAVTGAIDWIMVEEIIVHSRDSNLDDDKIENRCAALIEYIRYRSMIGDTGSIEGWRNLWMDGDIKPRT